MTSANPLPLRKLYAKIIAALFALTFLAACPTPQGGNLSPGKAAKIALLVPSGGANAGLNAIGEDMKRAAALAVSENGEGFVELIILETGGSEVRAAQLATQAKAEGALLIVGPLKSTEAVAVSNVVDLPILAFTNNSEVAQGNVYAIGTTFDILAERLMKFAKGNGSRALGIVHTQDLGGNQAASALMSAANNNGLSVVSTTSYPLSIGAIQIGSREIAVALNTAGVDSVALTDVPSGGLSYILSGLESNGVNAQNSKFYGLSKWNAVPELLTLTAANGAYFVAPDPAQAARVPNQLGGANELANLAYDGVDAAIELVKSARASGDNTPFDHVSLISKQFDGALGKWRLTGRNIADRPIVVMQVSGGQARVVSGAQRAY